MKLFRAPPLAARHAAARRGLSPRRPHGPRPFAALLTLGFCGLAGLAWLPAAAQSAATPAGTPSDGMSVVQAGAPVTLNFVNAEIEHVSRAIGAMLNRQIIVDPRVKGQVTITTERAVPPQEAYRTFLASLRGMGFTVVESGGFLKVVPESDAKLQTGIVTVGPGVTQRGDQVITQVFKLNYENPNNLIAVLRPLIGANNTINAAPSTNSLVITDYADNLQRIARIIVALDQPAASEIEVFTLKYAVASDIAPLVQRLTDAGGGTGTGGAPTPAGAATSSANAASVQVDPRSNSLIVRTANAARMTNVRQAIEKLDRPVADGGPAGNIWVVYLKNADATKIAEVLRAAIGGGSGGGGGGSSSSSTSSGGAFGGASSSSLSSNALSSGSTSSTGSSGSTLGGSASSGGTSGGASSTPVSASPRPSTGGFIQADPATNSLIITAPEPLYRQVRSVIDRLDTRRAQIFIESMIVELDADKVAQFGVQWQNLFGERGDSTLYGIGTNFGAGSNNILNLSAAAATGGATGIANLIGANPISGGLNIGIARQIGDFYTLGALANFLQTATDANVLSTPNLLALDNEEARIIVGQNVPFVTGSFTSTGTGTATPFQTIDRQDVGLTLKVRPQVGEGRSVRMALYQENSNVVTPAAGTSSSSGPTTNKSAIETTITVDDGSIIVLGGLMTDSYENPVNKVPFLGDLPVVGGLFRNESRTRRKRNLMIFLRPVVLRDQASANQLTMDRYEAIRALQTFAQPTPSTLLPINEAPVLPALNGPSGPSVPPIDKEPSLSLPDQAPPPPASAPDKPQR